MKKQKFFVGLIISLFLCACKKVYNCTCESGEISYQYKLIDSKKNAAKAVCENKGIGGREVEGVLVEAESITCKLK